MRNVAEPMYTVTEVAELLVANARHACAEASDREGLTERPDPASIDRARSGIDIVQEQLAGCDTQADRETVFEATLGEIATDLWDFKGLEVRHLEIRLRQSLERLTAQLNAMMYRNLELRVPLDTEALREFVEDEFEESLEPEEVETPQAFIARMDELMGTDPDEKTPLSEALEQFLDRHYIVLSKEELAALNRKRSMKSVFALLNQKRNERRPNDALVQYGRVPGMHDRLQNWEVYERFGGVTGAARGLAVKHVGDLFDYSTDSKTGWEERFGIIDAVPTEARSGALEQAAAPVRVYLRTDHSLSHRDFSSPIDMLNAELKIYKNDPNARFFDYPDFGSMMDDGWTLD